VKPQIFFVMIDLSHTHIGANKLTKLNSALINRYMLSKTVSEEVNTTEVNKIEESWIVLTN